MILQRRPKCQKLYIRGVLFLFPPLTFAVAYNLWPVCGCRAFFYLPHWIEIMARRINLFEIYI